ncbi:MAG TPA: DUF1553 domain-containing protein [Urbifossiella sp.]|nr:DUF1553 domain-containing protein [Urbifossiella sp.]
MFTRPVLATVVALACAPPAPAAEPVSLTREVIPVLTKAGCNSGTCHGTPTGKNGFRLSLRGYDPALDVHTLTREMGARRIDRVAPDRSLILQKGTALAPHAGGRRLDPDGDLYRLLRDWIAQGAPDDRDRSSRPVSLAVTPAQTILDAPASAQTLNVVAAFPDGAKRDVTHLTRFTVTDELAARVGADGTVTRSRAGEVVVTAEYMGLVAPAVILFRDENPNFRWPDPAARNYVDEHVFAKLKTLRIEPSPLCTDEEFVRRAHLDAVGRLPTPGEVRAFLADGTPAKRERLIDALLDRPEFADWWALKWSDRLGVNQRFVGKIGAVKYHQWVRGAMAANVPEDVFARTVLTAAGGNYSNPPAGFFRRLRSPELRAEEVAQLFMGARIQCAKCHNHPGESWTQDDFYGVAAFFARVQYRDGPFFVQVYDKEETVLTKRDGSLAHPRTGLKVTPKAPGAPAVDVAPDADARAAFADWLTAPGNPYFARAAANRIWFYLLGRGVVDPVDDLRVTNPPGVPALLDALTADLVRNGFDRKHLIRTVMNSRVYQASGRPTPTNRDDWKYFSRYAPRRLGAEALLDAVCDATGVPESFKGFPAGTRAVQLPDGEFPHPFLRVFGRPPRASACECEREADTTLHTALMLQGGAFLQEKLTAPKGRVATLAASKLTDREVVEEMFLLTLARRPTADETGKVLAFLAAGDQRLRRQRFEDVMHALLNHPEFLFQH